MPLIDAEINKHVVAVIPVDTGAGVPWTGHAGSGTCITVGGRFFVATAAHVIHEHRERPYLIASARTTDFVPFLKGAGFRGGKQGEAIDVGWLELTDAHAKALGRAFLNLQRLRTHCTGNGEALAICGAPITLQQKKPSPEGKPLLSVGAQCFMIQARGLKEDLGEEPDLTRNIYMHWPKRLVQNDGTSVEYPEAPGISGGGVWAVNANHPRWSASCIQLVGIEHSWAHRGVPDRFLRANQIQLWLQMLAEDLPALRGELAPLIAAGRFDLRSR